MNKIKIHKDNLPKGRKTPIFTYCRQLIAEGVDPQMSLEVYGPSLLDNSQEILHMRVNIGNAAKLTVDDETTTFKRYKTREEHFNDLKAGKKGVACPRTEEFTDRELG